MIMAQSLLHTVWGETNEKKEKSREGSRSFDCKFFLRRAFVLFCLTFCIDLNLVLLPLKLHLWKFFLITGLCCHVTICCHVTLCRDRNDIGHIGGDRAIFCKRQCCGCDDFFSFLKSPPSLTNHPQHLGENVLCLLLKDGDALL